MPVTAELRLDRALRPVPEALSPEQARAATNEVKARAADLWRRLLDLYEGNAHGALGYSSWAAYCTAEFGTGRDFAYKLLDAGRVARAIEAASTTVDSPPSAGWRAAYVWGHAEGADLAALPDDSLFAVVPIAYDEPRRRVRLSASASKSRRALWVELPDVLADAIEASLPPREDRDPDGRLFPGSGADALRTSIAKACAALAIPIFSPHDLRHRRISLLHQQGRSWAEVGAFVGQRKLSITADTYTHVLIDGREVDLLELLVQAQTESPQPIKMGAALAMIDTSATRA